MLHPIRIACEDVATVAADVLLLKYAQAFHGADAHIFSKLYPGGKAFRLPIGHHKVFHGGQGVAARRIVFLGTPRLFDFGYAEIRAFAAEALRLLPEITPAAATIAMTIHGVGYGLDEREAFLAQLAGIADACQDVPSDSLKEIVIVERDPRRASRLETVLQEAAALWSQPARKKTRPAGRIDAGANSEDKPHVFVAMPFLTAMEDVYEFGILEPVRAAGYLCERVDMAVFSGDIVQRIKDRIDTATLVVADLTGANANVYLEVGYAWGRNKKTCLIAKEGEELKFDTKAQRCIFYKSIRDLKARVSEELPALLKR